MIVARKGKTFATWHRQNRDLLLKRITPAERAFSMYLAARGLTFRQQQGFYTPIYRIADFFLPDQNLIIEIDGPYHDAEKDRIKDERFLKERGIRTLRLTNEQVLSARACLQWRASLNEALSNTMWKSPVENVD